MKLPGFNIQKIKSYVARHHILLLSFFLPSLILEIAYACHGIFPVWGRSLLIVDLYHQYAPFLSDLQEKFKSLSGFLYSTTGGLGTGYLPLYGYYAASPLNILIVLFPKQFLSEAVLILTLIKIGLCGLFFTLFLSGIHKEKKLAMLVFSSFYALSSYVLAFSWNIMWLDALYLFPLVMLGLITLIRDGKGILFAVTLALTLFSNFYMAFFVVFFIVLYYPLCLFNYNNKPGLSSLVKKTLQAVGYSLLAAGMSAILTLPTWFALRLTSAADDTFPKDFKPYFDLFDYITKHFTMAVPSVREGMPNIYCGIIILVLLPVYFLSRGIHLKEKLWHLALVLILIASFNTDTFNFIWHGLHFPNQIPYRFSFVYIFLVLSMGYNAFRCINEFTARQIGAICIIIFGIIILSQKFDELKLDNITIYTSMAFMILYAAAFSYYRGLELLKDPRSGFLVAVIIIELLANTIMTVNRVDGIEGFSTRNGYSSGKEPEQIRENINKIKKQEQGFYRMELMPSKTANDPYLYNYQGFSLFSSTAPEKPVRMFKNLGFHSNGINSYEYEGSTALMDSLFGIKYIIHRNKNITEIIYEKIADGEKISVYKNPYAFSPGFSSGTRLKQFSSYSSNPFNSQNNLYEIISGVKDILQPLEMSQGTHENLTFSSSGSKYYSFKRTNRDSTSTARLVLNNQREQQVYLYYRNPYGLKGTAFVAISGKKVEFNPRHSTMINLGYLKAGVSAEMQIDFKKESSESGTFEVYAATLDKAAFIKAVETIKEQELLVTDYRSSRIKGTVKAKENGIFVFTMPYDKGWQVKVDGRKTDTYALENCLLAFDINEGNHSIEVNYMPDKFREGTILTIASLLILGIILYFRRKEPSCTI